jgi:Ankyrin repeat
VKFPSFRRRRRPPSGEPLEIVQNEPGPAESFTKEEVVSAIEQGRLLEWSKDKKIAREDFLKSENYPGSGRITTFLHFAIEHGRLDQADAVLEERGERFTMDDFFKLTDSLVDTGLQTAARHGHLDQLNAAFEKYGEHLTREIFTSPSPPAKGCWTPLHIAARCGHLEQVADILEKYGDRLTKSDLFNSTDIERSPFHEAANGGHIHSAAEVLARNGEHFSPSDFLIRDRSGSTPLRYAADGGYAGHAALLNSQVTGGHAETGGYLDQIFVPENFVGQLAAMEALWREVPTATRGQIDYDRIRQRVLELSLHRARPVQHLEHGIEPGTSEGSEGPDRSQEGKS